MEETACLEMINPKYYKISRGLNDDVEGCLSLFQKSTGQFELSKK